MAGNQPGRMVITAARCSSIAPDVGDPLGTGSEIEGTDPARFASLKDLVVAHHFLPVAAPNASGRRRDAPPAARHR